MTVETEATQAAPLDRDEGLELPDIDVTSYDLGGELGHGGMGKVLAARDRRLKRMLAIKVSRSSDPGSLARFAREALLTARLQHPAIVPIHEAGRLPSGEPFYAMKLVAGRSLDQLVAATRSLDERLALLPRMIAVVDALAYAHAQRVIHRDLKPNNVIVGDYGETIVIDWGLAKELGTPDEARSPYREQLSAGMTVEGQAMGTPSYMSPEQAAGESVDERADVYGLGAMLYHVLCGTAPYDGKTADAVIAQVLSGPPRALGDRQAGIPRDLLAIVAKAMAREPVDRYVNAGALADDLNRFYRGQLVAAHRYTTAELLRRWLRRHRAVVSAIAVASIAVLVIGFFAVSRIARQTAIAEQIDRDARRSDAVNLGRDELLAGSPSRAIPSLVEAMRLGDDSVATRVLLGDAMRRVEAHHLAMGEQRTLELSKDGSRLLAIGDHAILWDVRDEKRIRDLGAARDATLSPDETTIAFVDDTSVHLWRDGREVGSIAAAGFEHVQFSPDGARIATTGASGACMFEVAARTRLWCQAGDTRMRRAAFSADGSHVATVDNTRHSVVEDAATGSILWTVDSGDEIDAVFEPAGTLVTVGSSGKVARWTAEGQSLNLMKPSGPAVFRLATNGKVVIAATFEDAEASLYTRDEPIALPASTEYVSAVGFVGTFAITVAHDGAVRLWDARSGGRVVTLEGGALAQALAVSADGNVFAVSSVDGVRVWDVRALQLPVTRVASGVSTMSADGTRALVVEPDHTVVIDVHTGRDIADLPLVTKAAVLSSDGQLVLTVKAEVWDVATRRQLAHIPLQEEMLTGRFMPTGDLWTLTRHGLQRWTTHGELVATIAGADAEAAPPVMSGDGRRIALPFHNSRLAIYDIATAVPVANLDLARGYIQGIALNRDASRAIVLLPIPPRNNFVTAALWDTTTNREMQSLGTDVQAFAYGADDAFIIGYRDGTVRVWDRDAKPLALLHGHTRIVESVALSSDHALAVTAGDDGTVRTWDVKTGHEVSEVGVGGDRVIAGLARDDRHIIASTGKAVWWWTIPFELRAPDAIVTRDAAAVSSGVTPAPAN